MAGDEQVLSAIEADRLAAEMSRTRQCAGKLRPGAPYAGWPDFAQTWIGDSFTFPAGRGQQRPVLGWQCSGCGRGLNPRITECPHCPENKTPAFIGKQDVMGDWGDET